MKKNLLFFLCLICLHQAFSQSYQFNRQIRGVELPSNNISGILQDDMGLMWFTTASGIFYSDGFNTYPLPDTIQSQLSAKSNFFKDENGFIWVYSTYGAPKAFYFSQNQWFEFFFPKSFDEKKLNRIKFAVGGEGADKVFFLVSDGETSFTDIHSKNWVTTKNNLGRDGSFVGLFNDKGSIYLFFEKAIFRFSDNALLPFEFEGIKLPAPVVSVRIDEETGGYFFLGENYLAYGKSFSIPEKIVHQNFSKDIYSPIDHFYLQVDQGKVFYFYNSHLYKYDPNQGSAFEINSGDTTKSFYITTAYVGREGVIWIGSLRGLLNINSLKFLNYNSGVLLDDEVTAIIKIGPAEYLLGFNNGLEIWENGKKKVLQEDKSLVGQPRNRITNFSMDKNGIVWFSSNLAGIGRFDPKNLKLDYTPSPLNENINSIKAIGDSLFFVSWGKIYLSSIHHSGPKHFEHEINNQFLGKLNQDFFFFRKIDVLSDGRLIFVQAGDTRAQDLVVETDSFINVIGYNYLESGDTLLLGTELGLMYHHKGKVDFMSWNGVVINRPVYALLKDANSNLWVGTDQGIFMVNNGIVRQFEESNGLAGSEINRGALVEGEDGKI
ncbi:two-component regulator propeller domain-containing protein [Rhodonellum sp.]|uniref:two-component regulator propeller domain-containing protein n=1 Tax=Rhodonellum sp. TaxID=2231180 RepID=UPI002725AE59|nr:two-component regulator propeller domain-containing protein [Rhodonellum sp.]MDO9551028.1 two-component regulator propeller domain-containing protein [Rhodonellum sp.]